MSAKIACGGCGKSDGCGCQKTVNPYEESNRAVWHTPTEYDALKHGPSFFPGMKLSSSQKKGVKAYVKAAESPPVDVPAVLLQMTSPWKNAFIVLSFLRAAAFVHQTHHWLTRGPNFYGDHQLFERLYTETQEGIDQLAEKIVGSSDVGLSAIVQSWMMNSIVAHACAEQVDVPPDGMVSVSLSIEVGVLKALESAKNGLSAEESLSPGTSNLFDGVYDKHESFIYLLQQRAEIYTYDRR